MTDNGSPPPAPPPSSPLPAVTRRDQIDAHDGHRVRLIGRYVEIDVRMAPRPPPRLTGHVAIELADGARVTLLPVWHRDAPRPAYHWPRFRLPRPPWKPRLPPARRTSTATTSSPSILYSA